MESPKFHEYVVALVDKLTKSTVAGEQMAVVGEEKSAFGAVKENLFKKNNVSVHPELKSTINWTLYVPLVK